MRRLSFLRFPLISLFAAAFLFSCKSGPELPSVDPFELLDGDAAIYLTIPVKPNQEFVKEAVKRLSDASESDAERIAGRLDMLYVAVGMSGEIQLSMSGKIPTTFLSMALSEKKGWRAAVMENQLYYTHSQSLYQLCAPTSSVVFLSRDIGPMIRRYNKLAYSEPPLSEPVPDGDSSIKLVSELLDEKSYDFLHESVTSDIVLYAPFPKALMRSFLGGDVTSSPVESVSAVLSQDRGVLEEFNVRLILTMGDSRTVRAATVLIKAAMFGIPAKVAQTGERQITITDLPVSRDRLLSLIR